MAYKVALFIFIFSIFPTTCSQTNSDQASSCSTKQNIATQLQTDPVAFCAWQQLFIVRHLLGWQPSGAKRQQKVDSVIQCLEELGHDCPVNAQEQAAKKILLADRQQTFETDLLFTRMLLNQASSEKRSEATKKTIAAGLAAIETINKENPSTLPALPPRIYLD